MVVIEIDDTGFDNRGIDLSHVLRNLAERVMPEFSVDGAVTHTSGEVVGSIKYTKEAK